MALSLSNRGRAQTSKAWATQKQPSISNVNVNPNARHLPQYPQKHQYQQQHQQQQLQQQLQQHQRYTNQRGYLTRGYSVDRSFESIRQRIIGPGGRQKVFNTRLQRRASIDQDCTTTNNHLKLKDANLKSLRNPNLGSISRIHSIANEGISGPAFGTAQVGETLQKKSFVAWSSTQSLLKSLDHELEKVNSDLVKHRNSNNLPVSPANAEQKVKPTATELTTTTAKSNTITSKSFHAASSHSNNATNLKTDANKINLNIVLSQTIRATTDHEVIHSDIDSSSEGPDTICSSILKTQKSATDPAANKIQATEEKRSVITTSTAAGSKRNVLQRQNTIRSTPTKSTSPVTNTNATTTTTAATPTITSSSTTTTTTFSAGVTTASTIVSTQQNNNNLNNISSTLTVQRRPPLVRAMSAPVRPIDENSKSIIAANRRKFKRRKPFVRNASIDKTDEDTFNNSNINNYSNKNKENNPSIEDRGNVKKVLSRARTEVASDVITLVSLISSEGSDSEKEDSSNTLSPTNSDGHSPNRRAPSLRKTGKSVSFQETYPPNYQLASKEYSHMIRRGSIAPVTTRLQANRPPTGLPVSLFLNDPYSGFEMSTQDYSDKSNIILSNSNVDDTQPTSKEDKENNASSVSLSAPEFAYPNYVCSIKERECWKLYKKMCTKGVSISYETVSRGMLTPTEFRQLQKQRDIEEAKEREAAELGNETEKDKLIKTSASAIERLSESLLKK